jgi:DNA-binding SARP family transcriptional activator
VICRHSARDGPHRLVCELTELVARHPLRERMVGHLMLALHRTGRQSDALRVYRRLRHQLADAVSLDPRLRACPPRARACSPTARNWPPSQPPPAISGFGGSRFGLSERGVV